MGKVGLDLAGCYGFIFGIWVVQCVYMVLPWWTLRKSDGITRKSLETCRLWSHELHGNHRLGVEIPSRCWQLCWDHFHITWFIFGTRRDVHSLKTTTVTRSHSVPAFRLRRRLCLTEDISMNTQLGFHFKIPKKKTWKNHRFPQKKGLGTPRKKTHVFKEQKNTMVPVHSFFFRGTSIDLRLGSVVSHPHGQQPKCAIFIDKNHGNQPKAWPKKHAQKECPIYKYQLNQWS